MIVWEDAIQPDNSQVRHTCSTKPVLHYNLQNSLKQVLAVNLDGLLLGLWFGPGHKPRLRRRSPFRTTVVEVDSVDSKNSCSVLRWLQINIQRLIDGGLELHLLLVLLDKKRMLRNDGQSFGSRHNKMRREGLKPVHIASCAILSRARCESPPV